MPVVICGHRRRRAVLHLERRRESRSGGGDGVDPGSAARTQGLAVNTDFPQTRLLSTSVK